MNEVLPIHSVSWMPQPTSVDESPTVLVAANTRGAIQVFEENPSTELQFLERGCFRLDSTVSLAWTHSLTSSPTITSSSTLTSSPTGRRREKAACFLAGRCSWDEWSDFSPNRQLLLCRSGNQLACRLLVHKPLASLKDASLSASAVALPLLLEADSSLLECAASDAVFCEEHAEIGGFLCVETLQHGCLHSQQFKRTEAGFEQIAETSYSLGFTDVLVFASLSADGTLTTITSHDQQLVWERYVHLSPPRDD